MKLTGRSSSQHKVEMRKSDEKTFDDDCWWLLS